MTEPQQKDPTEEFSRPDGERVFGSKSEPNMVLLPGDLSALLPPPPEPPSLADLAWAVVKAFGLFLLGVAITAFVVTWLWNSNIATTEGVPETDVHVVASAIVILRIAAFHWKGFRR